MLASVFVAASSPNFLDSINFGYACLSDNQPSNRRSDGARRSRARRYDYIGRKDPVTGEITCPWRKGRGKVQSGGSSGVQMAG